MASVKLATLAIRTIAKPIANSLKNQAQQHESFRRVCIELAQWSHRSEVRLRTGLLGESPKSIKPLNDTRAIQNGANSLAEGFLFLVAAGLIIGESWRAARKDSNRRDVVNDRLADLEGRMKAMGSRMDGVLQELGSKLDEDRRQDF
ncbi:hypothetical protein BS47DRAFT_252061 [Hydnum rufescens UP504]|uniref:OPA3-like protein n=1 Tax=Hydnum rufescens UP504 TaxID=1448309 RepID=A0A9P6AMC4_9AGAM|nr:hypothetical protein BS47DRAFT_252061 [Hydnum rufescens UP504]